MDAGSAVCFVSVGGSLQVVPGAAEAGFVVEGKGMSAGGSAG